MTQERFWELYESHEVPMKIYHYTNQAAGEGELVEGEVIAFTDGGKFYFRIAKRFAPSGYRRRYKNAGWMSATFKEFESKAQANAYFKKAFAEYTRF